MRAEFRTVVFEDTDKAAGNLERLEQQLAPTLLTPLASLLSQSPDADGAVNLLERYAQGASTRVLGDLARCPAALSYLVAIFGYSGYLAETLLAEPELAVQFARDRNFIKLKSKEDLTQDFARFSTTSPDPWLAALLARFKRRNYLRIVLKDVLGLSTLGETTLELSTLADVILSDAYMFCDRELAKRYGQPQYRDAQGRIARAGFSIVSLGKLEETSSITTPTSTCSFSILTTARPPVEVNRIPPSPTRSTLFTWHTPSPARLPKPRRKERCSASTCGCGPRANRAIWPSR